MLEREYSVSNDFAYYNVEITPELLKQVYQGNNSILFVDSQDK